MVLGGGSALYLTSPSASPVLDSVEVVGPCPASLPDYPHVVFGASLHWDGQTSVHSCGGATWTETFQDCFVLQLRFCRHNINVVYC